MAPQGGNETSGNPASDTTSARMHSTDLLNAQEVDSEGTVVLGFHGTSVVAAEAIVRSQLFRKSENDWDWLGHGVYFWEGPSRAWQWAEGRYGSAAAVVCANIRLGACVDLTDAPAWVDRFRDVFENVKAAYEALGRKLPSNIGGARFLDCMIFNQVAEAVAADTLRSVFLEGEELFEGTTLRSQQHVQICVRNLDNILRPIRHLERSLQ